MAGVIGVIGFLMSAKPELGEVSASRVYTHTRRLNDDLEAR